MENVYIELVRLIPSLLWFVLTVVIFSLFYKPIRHELLPKLTGFSFKGVKFSFLEKSIDAAIIELAQKNPKWDVAIPAEAREAAVNRAKKNLSLFEGAQILWVDDEPRAFQNERNMFVRLKTQITVALNTEEAVEKLARGRYDFIISDMARGADPAAGLTLLMRLQQNKDRTPVIFYIGIFDPAKGVPPLAFGITNRPDELLHLALDVLERTKN